MLSPYWQPDLTLAHVDDLELRLLQERGIRGVLLDLDNTLTPWRSLVIVPTVVAWVQQLTAAGLRACILSNAASHRRVRPVADTLGIPYVTRALKPLAPGFRRAMALIGTTPDTTAIIGDQLFTDVWGGKRLGLFTVLVDPIAPHESFFTRLLQRSLERQMGRKMVG